MRTIRGTLPFEVFCKKMTPLAKAPSVAVRKRGLISPNKAVHGLGGNAETVALLYYRDRQGMAVRPYRRLLPHADAVRTGSAHDPGQATVSAMTFTAHDGTGTTATRGKPFIEDRMLCVDLAEGAP